LGQHALQLLELFLFLSTFLPLAGRGSQEDAVQLVEVSAAFCEKPLSNHWFEQVGSEQPDVLQQALSELSKGFQAWSGPSVSGFAGAYCTEASEKLLITFAATRGRSTGAN